MDRQKIYDITFKKMFRLSSKMLVKFVNKVFDKHFELNEKVIFLDPNTENEENDVLEKDLYFEIRGERFQIEAQSYWDDMMFRLFEYAVNSTEGNYERIDTTHATFTMPKQAVVFLKGTNKANDRLFIKIIFPDGQEVEYAVNAIRALGYTPQELVENELEILLPFQIIRMWNRVDGYSKATPSKKDKFLMDFSDMCSNIVNTIDELLTIGNITNDEYYKMLLIINDLKEYIYSEINDITEEGADAMLNERIVLSYDKAIEQGKKQQGKETARTLISKGVPADIIEQSTGLNLSELKSLASSINKALVV